MLHKNEIKFEVKDKVWTLYEIGDLNPLNMKPGLAEVKFAYSVERMYNNPFMHQFSELDCHRAFRHKEVHYLVQLENGFFTTMPESMLFTSKEDIENEIKLYREFKKVCHLFIADYTVAATTRSILATPGISFNQKQTKFSYFAMDQDLEIQEYSDFDIGTPFKIVFPDKSHLNLFVTEYRKYKDHEEMDLVTIKDFFNVDDYDSVIGVQVVYTLCAKEFSTTGTVYVAEDVKLLACAYFHAGDFDESSLTIEEVNTTAKYADFQRIGISVPMEFSYVKRDTKCIDIKADYWQEDSKYNAGYNIYAKTGIC